MKQRPCEREWSMEKATRTRLLIEKLTGEVCPCLRGKACPVLPMEGADRLAVAGASDHRGSDFGSIMASNHLHELAVLSVFAQVNVGGPGRA